MNKRKDGFTSAVIVAAGKSSRMGMDISKQFIEISGIPVLSRTIRSFEDSPEVREIIVVVNKDHISYCKRNIIDLYGFKKVKCLVPGGNERQESVFNGLEQVDKDCDVVLIHDGARPFVDKRTISDSIRAALEFGAACVGVPVKDTIKIIDDEGFIKGTPDRGSLWAAQTPQSFKFSVVMTAHERAVEDGFTGTDDAMLVEHIGIKVKLVMGSYDNIKITTKEDLAAGEAILRSLTPQQESTAGTRQL